MNTEQILSLVRTVLKFLGGYAVGAGILTVSNVDTVVGAVVTIIAAAWSWYSHKDIVVPSDAVKAVELKPDVDIKVDPSNPPEIK